MTSDLNKKEKALLQEVVRSGTIYASNRLGQLLKTNVFINPAIVSVKELQKHSASVVVVYIPLKEGMESSAISLFIKKDILKSINTLLGKPMGAEAGDITKEICNILTGSFLTVINNKLGMNLYASAPPYFIEDRSGQKEKIGMPQVVIKFKIEIDVKKKKKKSDLYFVPSGKILAKIKELGSR